MSSPEHQSVGLAIIISEVRQRHPSCKNQTTVCNRAIRLLKSNISILKAMEVYIYGEYGQKASKGEEQQHALERP